nr:MULTISPECIES: hypothetical protein [Chryseobacterium]
MFFVESAYALPAADFKNYYLRDEGQQNRREYPTKRSCELLSKIIIFVMKDNVNAG